MAINLLNNSISGLQNNGQSVQTNAAGGTSALMRQAAAAILKEVSGLNVGDTIQGQLVSKDGSSIELLLGNNARLATNLEQDMNLSLGQLLSFEVKSNQGGQLTLRPLFANMSNSSTIMNALDAAGLPASDTTIKMVDTLMQNSMPVNKEMLTTINRELAMYPDADVEDIVMLHKMDIPVNEGNVHQMHLYNNNNQWMLENVSDSAEQLTSMLSEVMGENPEAAANILEGLKELLPPGEEEPAVNILADNDLTGEVAAGAGAEIGAETAAVAEGAEENVTQMSGQTAAASEAMQAEGEIKNDTATSGTNAADKAVTADPAGTGEPVKAEDTAKTTDVAQRPEAPAINKNNVFDELAKMDRADLQRPEIRAQVKDALTELMKDNFLMNPKDIKEEKFVPKYYERTAELADSIEKLMVQNGKEDSSFAKSMTGMKENGTFMNHINDMYNYVQLPLKMNESQANGDLYVYARKKGRAGGGEDGKLTALLHLSMEHLGNMDVFLTLSEGQKLNTKFTLEKEEMIDFIASHIDELNARLQKKGYNVGTVVTHADGPEKSVIEKITGEENHILLSTQSFDARA